MHSFYYLYPIIRSTTVKVKACGDPKSELLLALYSNVVCSEKEAGLGWFKLVNQCPRPRPCSQGHAPLDQSFWHSKLKEKKNEIEKSDDKNWYW